VSGVDHFGRDYGGPVATQVVAVRSDGVRVNGRTAANGHATLSVEPGDYTLSAKFPACQTKHIHVSPGGKTSVRLDCALH
jgi:hypothetical protein